MDKNFSMALKRWGGRVIVVLPLKEHPLIPCGKATRV